MNLLQIQTAPTAETSVIRLNSADNVAIARVPLAAGQVVRVAGVEFRVRSEVPAGHKVALTDIASGAAAVRYGCQIGRASTNISRGDHIHTQNLAYEETSLDDQPRVAEMTIAPPVATTQTFDGYLREDGRAGTRNYIAVVAASNCAAHAAELIAEHFLQFRMPEGVDGVVAFPHGDGCGQAMGPDIRQLQRVIAGVLDHPNVASGVLLGLGCEVNRIDQYFPTAARRTKNLVGLTLQSSGGTRATVEAGIAEVEKMLAAAAGTKRQPISASKIVLGLNCGGSDSFSGISANPALGFCSDMLAEIGATAVLAETTEIFGAEQLLLRRARNQATADKLIDTVRGYKRYLNQFGGSFDDNPSPGNKDGGLTNIVEKSLGAVAKGGTSPLMDVVDYAERINSRGLVFMNTPGYDPASLTGLAAGGVNLIAFTTGRGSAIGFPTVPVVKIATNSDMYNNMRENMDINAGRIVEGKATVEDVGREIFQSLLDVASGRRTFSEQLGHKEFVPWRIGPMM